MNDSTETPRGQRFSHGVLAGIALGFFISVLVFGAGGYAWATKQGKDARRGWNLVPVVVAAQDLPQDSLITFDHISQRLVPEQFVTRSVVLPTHASDILNQRLRVPMQAGDLMLWSHFDREPPPVAGASTP